MEGGWLSTIGAVIFSLALCTAAGASRLPLAYMAEVATAEASSNATTEPLLESPVFPLYDKLTPDNMVSSLQTLFGQLDTGITALEAQTPRTWDALLEPYERLGDALNTAWGVVEHLQEVKNSDALRAAIAQVQDGDVRLGSRFSESRALYDAFGALQNSTQLTEVQKRIVEGIQLTAVQGGVTLQGAQLERFNNITLQLSNLSTTFSNNVVDATAAFTKLINDSAQLAGLPPSFLAQAAQKASAALNVTATPETGPWLITLDEPSYIAVLTFSANRELREEVYKAFVTRATAGDSDNGPVIESILALRQEQANLTGYANYAEFSLASKMANMTTAMQLLEELRSASYDTAGRELKDLQSYAASQNFSDKLMNWDVTYWAQRQQKALFNLTDEEVRPYFVYENVLKGLFQLGHHLFNVTVEAADGEVPVWDPSVRFFRLYRNGVLKGYLYIDPFARPGEKSAGAWMDGIVGESKLLAAPGEDMRLPVAIIVTNQSPPVGNDPALMTMEEVVTIFHEFGHAMQHTMTMQTDVLVSGIAGIEQDAVEQPSQMLERWPYTRNVCFSFARHYQTNESMPEALYAKLLAARNYRSGSDSLRQIFYALMDLRIHAEYAPGANSTVEQSAVYRDVIAKTSVMPPLPQDRFLNSFTHIFSGGYAAGYYGYKWAQVMSLDGFAAFEEIGLNNTDAIASEGLKYRNTILADGGGRAPLLVFEDFRGRPPSTKALLRDENLLPSKGSVTAAVQAQSLDL